MAAALCTPNGAWPNATAAGIRPIEAEFSQREVPVEHRSAGSYTLERSQYPEGILVIPTGHDPSGVPAVLPAIVTSGNSQYITLDPNDLMDYGQGVTIVFT